MASTGPAAGRPLFEPATLDPRQQRLVDRLAARPRGDKYVRIYMGALRVYGDAVNPDRDALTAHGLRELVEILCRDYGAPLRTPGDSLGQRVNIVQRALQAIRHGSPAFPSGPGDGGLTRSLVTELDALFLWVDDYMPNARGKARQAVTSLDVRAATSLTELDRRAAALTATRLRLTKHAHHSNESTPSDFAELVAEFEALLLDILSGPVQDIDELDELLRSGDA
jgi:hypothetical protein